MQAMGGVRMELHSNTSVMSQGKERCSATLEKAERVLSVIDIMLGFIHCYSYTSPSISGLSPLTQQGWADCRLPATSRSHLFSKNQPGRQKIHLTLDSSLHFETDTPRQKAVKNRPYLEGGTADTVFTTCHPKKRRSHSH